VGCYEEGELSVLVPFILFYVSRFLLLACSLTFSFLFWEGVLELE
jgi:hypothetical protein